MKNKNLIFSCLITVLILLPIEASKAEDYTQYCGQVYQLCVQARSLGSYAQSLGVYSDLSSFDCNEIISACSGGSSSFGPEAEDYYESNQDYSQSTDQTTTKETKPELTPEEQEALAQAQAKEDWLDYLNLVSGEMLVDQLIDEGWVKTYYRPDHEEGELGLTGKAKAAHNLFAQATQNWLDAIDSEPDSGTIRALKDLMKNANFDYMESLVNVLIDNPRDSTANHELSQQYFNEGTVEGFIMGRELESRAFVNLDTLERQTLDARVKEETERNGFAKAFYNPKLEESTFLTTMQNEISDQFSYVKDKSVDWLKQTDAYARAEAYSNEVRDTFKGFSLDIFHVDNTVINQAAYGE